MPISRAERKEYARDQAKLLYAMRRRYGLCINCGKEIDDEGTEYRCSFCQERYMKRWTQPEVKARRREHVKRRRDLLVAFGVCTVCGKRKPVEGGQKCVECRIKANRYNEKRRREKGIPIRDTYGDGIHCHKCHKPVLAGKKLCPDCYDKAIRALESGKEAREKAMKNHIWRIGKACL